VTLVNIITLSFTTGCVSIGIALLIYTQYRKEVIRFYALFSDAAVLFVVPVLLLYGTIASCLIVVAVNFRRMGNRTLKKALRVFFFVSLAFFPIFVFEINALSILLSIRYFNQPPFLTGSELTEHFKNSFGITDREGEIVSLLAKGQSYNQIAEALFISYKTVDNHIRNIYQKTSVRNRVQLINLLQANREA